MTQKRQNVGSDMLLSYFSENLFYVERNIHLIFYGPHFEVSKRENGSANRRIIFLEDRFCQRDAIMIS